MVFIFEADGPPYGDFIVDDKEFGVSVRHFIGRDIEKGCSYFVESEFSPYLPDMEEFSFCILERDFNSGDQNPILSGQDTSNIIEELDRESVLQVALAVTEHLLTLQRPMNIYRATNDQFPPEKALRKHYLISEMFKNHGYNVFSCDSWHGQRVWIATLMTEQEYRRWDDARRE